MNLTFFLLLIIFCSSCIRFKQSTIHDTSQDEPFTDGVFAYCPIKDNHIFVYLDKPQKASLYVMTDVLSSPKFPVLSNKKY